MRLSVFSDIALRVLLLTGSLPEGRQLTTRAVAEQLDASYHHVTKTVSRLVQLGLLASSRGRSGGIAITPAGLDASVGSVLRELSTGAPMVECAGPDGQCSRDHRCQLASALARAREAFYRELDDVQVRELVSDPEAGPAGVVLPMHPPGLTEASA